MAPSENLLLHYANVTFMLQIIFFVHNQHNWVSHPPGDNFTNYFKINYLRAFWRVTSITFLFLSSLLSCPWTNSLAFLYSPSSAAWPNLSKEQFPCQSIRRRSISAVSYAAIAVSPSAYPKSFYVRIVNIMATTLAMMWSSNSYPAFLFFGVAPVKENPSTPSIKL